MVVLGIIALLSGACAKPSPFKAISQEESEMIAEEFLRNSPTFVFDGIEETLQLTETLTGECPSCWTFVFEFESRHAGYGNRTGHILAQVITPHQAVISVEQGEIKSAIMDGKWDMLHQEMVGEEKAEES
jgi:hypothetical protein